MILDGLLIGGPDWLIVVAAAMVVIVLAAIGYGIYSLFMKGIRKTIREELERSQNVQKGSPDEEK